MGGKSTTTVTRDPPSPEQTQLTQRQIQLAEQQLKALNESTDFQRQLFDAAGPLIPLQTEVLMKQLAQLNDPEIEAFNREQMQFARDTLPIQREVLNMQLEELRRGGAASPEQIELIKQATEAGIAGGVSDIDRETQRGRDALKDFAAASGLRTSDSPILDRAAFLESEALRGKADLSSSLRGAEATARLNFPLAQGQLLNAQAIGSQNIATAAQSFQAALRDAALNARSQFAGALGQNIFGTAQGGLNIASAAGGGVSALSPAINALNASRGETRTARESGGFLGSFSTLASGLGGIGGLVGGLFPSGISSKVAKTGKAPIDEGAVLEQIERLPVEKWRYRPELGDEGRTHVGPYAEDFRRLLGLGDGRTINMGDAIGVLFAGMKDVAKRLRKVEDEEEFAFARG